MSAASANDPASTPAPAAAAPAPAATPGPHIDASASSAAEASAQPANAIEVSIAHQCTAWVTDVRKQLDIPINRIVHASIVTPSRGAFAALIARAHKVGVTLLPSSALDVFPAKLYVVALLTDNEARFAPASLDTLGVDLRETVTDIVKHVKATPEGRSCYFNIAVDSPSVAKMLELTRALRALYGDRFMASVPPTPRDGDRTAITWLMSIANRWSHQRVQMSEKDALTAAQVKAAINAPAPAAPTPISAAFLAAALETILPQTAAPTK